MCDEVETVKGFCYGSDRLNASGGCEAAVTSRTRVRWKKFRECGEILFGKRFSLWMKGKIYILKRAERSMVRAMCGVKLVDKRNIKELTNMLGLKEATDKLARANSIRWYGHVVR